MIFVEGEVQVGRVLYRGVLCLQNSFRNRMENPMFRHSMQGESDTRASRLKRKPMFDERGNLINGVKLMFEKGFGFNQGLGCAVSIDDNKMVYTVGKQVVLYDMLTEVQRVIDSFGQDEEVTCFKYFKNMMLDDNLLYALGAPSKAYPSLVLRNFSKGNSTRYVLSHLEKEEEVISLDLVNDYKHIAILSTLQGNPRFSMLDASTKEVYCSEGLYFQVKGVVVPFSNDKVVVLYGDNQLHLMQLGLEAKATPLKLALILQEQGEKIVDMVPAYQNQPNFYIITDKGNLYFITLNYSQSKIQRWTRQFLGTYETVDPTGKAITTHRRPSSLCCNEYNVLVGYHHIEEFTLVKVCALNTITSIEKIGFSCPMLHKIVRMTFAQETMAVCVIVQVKEGDRHHLSIPIQSEYLKEKGEVKVPKQVLADHLLPAGKTFPVVFNLLLHDTLVETLRSPIQSLLTSTMLTQKILDICMIPTKKLFLVLSSEKKIKAIKYEHISSTSFERMLAWECCFNPIDQPSSLDTHPLTLSVAVAFRDGLKLFMITSQGLSSTNIQFPLKNCECVRYSRYGHKLVAGSLNQLVIINPYQNKIMNTIQMPSGYLVKELHFLQKDMFIQGIFGNGSTSIMTSEGSKIFQVWNKSAKCISAAFDSVFDIMAVSYPESITKFYRERGAQEFAVMWTYPYNITKILIVNEVGTIFMGTSTGKIRAHQWPFTDSMKFTKQFTELHLHSSAITDLRVSPDYSLLISGAEDGTVFISRISAISEGIPVNDPEVLSSFKSSYKNFKSLYYLQHYLSTSSHIQNDQDEIVSQLQSDKADFDTEYNDVIVNLQSEIDMKLKQEEQRRNYELRQQLSPLQQKIDEMNHKKLATRNEIASVSQKKSDDCFKLDEQKLAKIRQLYKQTDELIAKKQFYLQLYKEELQELILKQNQEKTYLTTECNDKTEKLTRECLEAEQELKGNMVSYQALMAEEGEEGEIYKGKMLEEMGNDLERAKDEGEQLRKRYNKLYHQNGNYQQKMKYFQQLSTELQIDIENATRKSNILHTEQDRLSKLLQEKDKQILGQQKLVKQLLSHNINNYAHEQYLKHKKSQLIVKEKYLQGEIGELDKKYNTFHDDFSLASKKAKEIDVKIINACSTIKKLKEYMKDKKETAYLRRYRAKEIETVIHSIYHDQPEIEQAKNKLKNLVDEIEGGKDQNGTFEARTDEAVGKRDYLIKQVVNTNNLRKIDDTIRRTIMVKLNRETVSLTWEVNQLRKEKKSLAIKIKEIQSSIGEHRQSEISKENCSDGDIVPANISIIRREASKHHSSQKLLPFQAYHTNKTLTKHSKTNTKDFDESSTQLPSLLKQNVSSSLDTSGLFGVQQIDDEIAM